MVRHVRVWHQEYEKEEEVEGGGGGRLVNQLTKYVFDSQTTELLYH